jgi:hypothetical protein
MGAVYVDAAAPGLAKAVRSVVSGPQTRQAGTLFGAKNIAEISKLAQEAEKAALENAQLRQVQPNQDLYGATSANVSVPEFQRYRDFRTSGGPMPTQSIGSTPVDDEGNPNVAPAWNADEQTKLANALRSVALMRASTAKYGPSDVVKAGAEQQGIDALNERLVAARAPDPGEAAPQGTELVRRLAAASGHNVLTEKDDRSQFGKALDDAGITDPAERQKAWKDYIATKSTHAPGVQINMPTGMERGTGPTGKPGVWQIGRDGQARFIETGQIPPSDPLKAFIAEALKNPGGNAPTNANADLKAKVESTPGWKWEPSVYNYRIGPNGKLQREKRS